jgi:hypothetical protein
VESQHSDLVITVHEVKIAIPPSINLIVTCSHNEEKYETPKKRRVDAGTQVANFGDQQLVIPMSKSNQSEESHHPQ